MDGLRLHLVRHGETEGQSSVRYHGSNDVPLSETGRGQIRGLIPQLANLAAVAREGRLRLWHSPMSRAMESAAILAAGLGLDMSRADAVESFREICFGRFEGFTAEEIRAADPEWHRRWQAGETEGFPDGEPRAAFRNRVRSGWAGQMESVQKHVSCTDVLVVAHRGIVFEGLVWLTGAEDERFRVELGSVSTAVCRAGAWEVERLGICGNS